MKTTSLASNTSSRLIATALAAAEDLLSPDSGAATALKRSASVAELLAALDADEDTVVGALIAPLVLSGRLTPEVASATFGQAAAGFAAELGSLGSFRLTDRWTPERKLSAGQAEVLRKMLLAVITDPRLVLVRLAEQLQDLRDARELPEDAQQRLARETREVYAPLASRLGIWQLKWELEDLAFRYLEPDDYMMVARKLNERRADRERYIQAIILELQEMLAEAGVKAEITGRPKHMYSIFRKMQRKHLGFEQVFDVRAVRILTDSVADCYAALGLVHGRWPYIPGEFDDYIATPKDNAYRSLHTAVIGPGKMPVEVQIRTREMHAHAELGVAAHWRYKEGGGRDAAYDRKIQWLRELLAPAADGEADRDFLDRVRADLFEDRVYVLTPKGDIVDLPSGATPLDYAYQVHTELGHRCRGARVNGRMVTLDYKLSNGEVVDILAGKQSQPSRDWLIEQQGYLASPRSRAKVRAWFKRQDEGRNRQEGRELFEREIARLGLQNAIAMPELLAELGLPAADALYLALGAGDLTVAQVSGAIHRRLKAAAPPAVVARPSAARRRKPSAGLEIEGVGDLASTFARCCNPVPPEPIAGYITVGRGVTIHREACASLERMRRRQPERVLSVSWGSAGESGFEVDIIIHAYDRHGLVRDLGTVLTEEKINIIRMTSEAHPATNTADIHVAVTIRGLEELSHLLARLKSIRNVVSARRRIGQ
jgi:GTP pyrophosphokinase